MRIIADVMSGDLGEKEAVIGAFTAANQNKIQLLLVGNKEKTEEIMRQNHLSSPYVSVFPVNDVLTMDDSPLSVIREKKDSSMAVGLKLLAEGKGDAFVSAGNTGALLAGATFLVRRIPGVKRAGIGTILPFEKPLLLLDSGANLDLSPEDAIVFALMGQIYMNKMFAVASPLIGQLNIGAESGKGTPRKIEIYKALSECSLLRFTGNVEPKKIPFHPCDVLITDGLTGNIAL
ncbi:MAG: phosphate--acyl-ACP acyltransferase, partial [Clostridia bacterium]|nr:phosphate--acyl-ACP acyltransferase [Clostridia bacterium]